MLGSKSEGQAYLQVPQVSELPVKGKQQPRQSEQGECHCWVLRDNCPVDVTP